MFLYLNNAATTFPKPPEVLAACADALSAPPSEGSRSSSKKPDPAQLCRELAAKLLHAPDPSHVILGASATALTNLVIAGFSGENHHIMSSVLEHNSVLRPLEHGRLKGTLSYDLVSVTPDGLIDTDALQNLLHPSTRLIVVSHASNVTGCVQPIDRIAALAVRYGAALLIDASQSAGAIDFDYRRLPGRVFVVAAAHKGLYGPSGTGLLIVPDAEIPPLWTGSTGIRSESLTQPASLPLRYEAGTPNLSGLAGLAAGLRFVAEQTVEALGRHRHDLVLEIRERLAAIKGVRLSPLANNDGRAGIISFTVDGHDPADIGYALTELFDIEVRTGLHCAPLIHYSLDTFPRGTVRAAVAAFNTRDDAARLVDAIKAIAEHGQGDRRARIGRLLDRVAVQRMGATPPAEPSPQLSDGNVAVLPGFSPAVFPHENP